MSTPYHISYKIFFIILVIPFAFLTGYASVYFPKLNIYIIISLICTSLLFRIKEDLYKKSFKAMIFFVSMFYVGAIDIGITIRLCHIFIFLAMFFGLFHNKLIKVKSKAFYYLIIFFCYSLLNTLIRFQPIDSLSGLIGIRGSYLRPILQCAQLLLMVSAYYLVISFCNSFKRYKITLNMIYLATSIVVIYGFYEFSAYYFDIPFVNINNPIFSLSPNVGYNEAAMMISGHHLKRISSTFPEPAGYAIYLQFGFAMIIARTCFRKYVSVRAKVMDKIVIFMVAIAFLLTFSRAGYSVVAVTLLLLLVYNRNLKHIFFVAMIISLLCFFMSFGYKYFHNIKWLSLIADLMQELFNMTSRLQGREQMFYPPTFDYESPDIIIHLFFGVGLGNDIHHGHVSSMNHYRAILYDLGIVGLVLYLFFVGKICIDLIKINIYSKKKKLKEIYIISLCLLSAIIMDSIFRLSFRSLTQHVLLWIVLGMGTSFCLIVNKHLKWYRYSGHSEKRAISSDQRQLEFPVNGN